MSVFATTPVDRMDRPYPRRWWALGVLCLSLLIIVMANTSLIVAAPDMTRDLGLSSRDLQWVIDAYTVPYAALMLVLGAIGDKYSRRGALITGLVVFAAGSVAGSLVHSTAGVIVARAIMGTGAAVIMPATLSLLVATFPRGERAKAITAWTATSGLAIAVGPLVAGWLLERHAWGSTFLINVPVALIALVAKLDLIGGALSIATLGSLVYAIIEGPHFGWGGGPVVALVVFGVGLGSFIAWELRHPRPIFNLRKFGERVFSGSMLAVLLFFLGTFGAIYFLTQHLQFVLGYGPLETGVRLLPLAGAVCVGAITTGKLTPLLGMRVTVTAGMALGTIGILLMTRVADGSGYGDFLAPLILLGVAIGLSVSPCTEAIMGSFPENELGAGGGVNDTAVELGGALGIAILGSVLATSYESELTKSVGGALPGPAMDVAKDSIGGALAAAEQVGHAAGPQQAQALIQAADHAFTQAVAHTSLVGGIVLAIGTVLVAVILPNRATTQEAGTTQAPSAKAPDRAKERVG
jgi:EmrB/QacA subfamily drug resistance transporter